MARKQFGKPFEELNRGQRRDVNATPQLVERVATFEDDPGSAQQQATAAFANWRRVNTDAEATLRRAIDRGLTGRALRDAISEFKGDRFVAGNAVFGNPEVETTL